MLLDTMCYTHTYNENTEHTEHGFEIRSPQGKILTT